MTEGQIVNVAWRLEPIADSLFRALDAAGVTRDSEVVEAARTALLDAFEGGARAGFGEAVGSLLDDLRDRGVNVELIRLPVLTITRDSDLGSCG